MNFGPWISRLRDDMRAVSALASVLICAGLFGCDEGQKVAVPLPAQTASVPCNCQPQVNPPMRQATAAQPFHRSWRRHRHGRFHAYGAQSEYNENSASSYSSAEESESYETEHFEHRNYGGGEEAHHAVWVDGYGRSHYLAAGVAIEDAQDFKRGGHKTGNRLDPWHGYDAECNHRDD
jgi:hypothetical protein